MVAIVDYVDVPERMKLFSLKEPTQAAILPRHFDSIENVDALVYPSEAKTVHSLIRQSGIVIDPLDEKIHFKEEQSFAFVSPLIFFASTVIAQNPHLIDLSINLLSDYIYDRIRGTNKQDNVKMEYVVETKSGKYKKINYEGPIEGLKTLPKVIKEIHDD